MQPLKCSLSLLLFIALVICHSSLAAPWLRVKRGENGELLTLEQTNDAELNPINVEEMVNSESLERNKRKLPDAAFEAKNAVLGYVFGRKCRGLDKDSDAAEISRTSVSFDIPDELFNKSFQTLTNVSKTISALIMNSARRYSRFVLFFKPIFGNALIVKGSEDPTTTTTTTTIRPSSTRDQLNEV